MIEVVAAKDVRVGDYLFNSAAKHPSYRWVRVKTVETIADRIVIHTSVWLTYKHPKEGVAVQRTESNTNGQ